MFFKSLFFIKWSFLLYINPRNILMSMYFSFLNLAQILAWIINYITTENALYPLGKLLSLFRNWYFSVVSYPDIPTKICLVFSIISIFFPMGFFPKHVLNSVAECFQCSHLICCPLLSTEYINTFCENKISLSFYMVNIFTSVCNIWILTK